MKTAKELGKIYEQIVGYDISTEITSPLEIISIMKEYDNESESEGCGKPFKKAAAY